MLQTFFSMKWDPPPEKSNSAYILLLPSHFLNCPPIKEGICCISSGSFFSSINSFTIIVLLGMAHRFLTNCPIIHLPTLSQKPAKGIHSWPERMDNFITATIIWFHIVILHHIHCLILKSVTKFNWTFPQSLRHWNAFSHCFQL